MTHSEFFRRQPVVGCVYRYMAFEPDPKPVRLYPPRNYHGGDARKQAKQRQLVEDTRTLEVYVNERRHPTETVVLFHSTIAVETGISEDDVEQILTSAGGGNNGITLAPTGVLPPK